MAQGFYTTYEELIDVRHSPLDRLDAMRKEIEHLREQKQWAVEYAERLDKEIQNKQIILDHEVEDSIKHK